MSFLKDKQDPAQEVESQIHFATVEFIEAEEK